MSAIGRSMTWGEAVRLTTILARDPSSQVFTSLAEWDHPASWEWIVLAELRDSTEYGRVGRKAKPFPRPWPDRASRRIGGNRSYSAEELSRVLHQTRAEVSPDG